VVADYYRRRGYQVEHCGTGRSGRRFDGGIDLKLYRDGSYTVVQCKRENAFQVAHNVGHQLLGVMLTEKADRAIVVNAGEFTPYALESARKDSRLQLIDGDELRRMLPQYAVSDPPSSGGADSGASLDWPLSGPPSHPVSGDVRYGRPRRQQDSHGIKALMALGALVVIVVWQCSTRSGAEHASAHIPPRQAAEIRLATPQSRPRSEVPAPERLQPAPSPARVDAAEAKRRADRAIQVIEDTTPELLLPPDPHAVYPE